MGDPIDIENIAFGRFPRARAAPLVPTTVNFGTTSTYVAHMCDPVDIDKLVFGRLPRARPGLGEVRRAVRAAEHDAARARVGALGMNEGWGGAGIE